MPARTNERRRRPPRREAGTGDPSPDGLAGDWRIYQLRRGHRFTAPYIPPGSGTPSAHPQEAAARFELNGDLRIREVMGAPAEFLRKARRQVVAERPGGSG